MSGTLHNLREFFSVIAVILIPIYIAIFTFLILAFPDQILELYRAIALDVSVYGEGAYWREFFLSVLGLSIVSISLYASSRFLFNNSLKHTNWHSGSARRTLIFAPLILACIPLLSAMIGIYRSMLTSGVSDENSILKEKLVAEISEIAGKPYAENIVERIFDYGLGAAMYWGIALVAILYFPLLIYLYRDALRSDKIQREGFVAIHYLFGFIVIACLAFGFASIWWPVELPQWTGTFFIFGVFTTILTAVFGGLSYLSQTIRLPITSTVLVLLLAFAWFGWNDNHRLRFIQDPPPIRKSEENTLPQLAQSFDLWLKNRPDIGKFEKYPVYIVAARGGGIYTAYYSAVVLASLQEQIPAFRHHLFAVSGVSGGSVGAAAFSAILDARYPGKERPVDKSEVRNEPGAEGQQTEQAFSLVKAVDDIFSEDLFAPLVAALAFPDLVQRFLPRPVESLDRARALEYALEAAWDKQLTEGIELTALTRDPSTNLLKKPFLHHWNPSSSLPALLLNTTEVGTGRRQLLAPFQFSGTDLSILDAALANNIRLSTGAVLSARFPGVTPEGWYVKKLKKEKDVEKIRLVDGGYFENSGTTTALDLFRELETVLAKQGTSDSVELKMIVLGLDKAKYYRFSGLGNVVGTLLNTGVSRAILAERTSERELNDGDSADPCLRDGRLMKVKLREPIYQLPLGWKWSDATRMLVRMQKGSGIHSGQEKAGEGTPLSLGSFTADCLAWRVKQQLNR